MISLTLTRAGALAPRQFSCALALGLSIYLCAGSGVAQADIVVDNFQTVSGLDTVVSNNGGAPTTTVEAGLTGTLGGQRTTSVQNLSGAETVTGTIDPTPGRFRFSSGGAASTTARLTYDGGGAGLPANLSPFGGVNVPFTFVNGVSGANPLGVTVQLTDGTNTATGSGQLTTNGAQTLLIDPSAFGGSLAGLDLTAITGIRFRFNASENNDFTIGPISIVIVPEPLAILGASTVLLVGLAGWRFAGRGLRRAD